MASPKQINPNAQTFAITGMEETLAVFQQLAEEIGDKKKSSKILINACKEALAPVLGMAKMLAPKGETHLLSNSLTIVGRRPTSKDRKSKYVSSTDTVIAIVTTKSIPIKYKKQFNATHSSLLTDYSRSVKGSEFRNITHKQIRSHQKKFYAGIGIPYDGRAPAMEWGTKTEFGTAHNSARPFMRPAMDLKGEEAANKLGAILMKHIEQYRSKNIK